MDDGDLLIAGFHAVRHKCFFFATHFICSSGIPNQNAFNSYMILLYLTTQAYFVLWSVQRNELLWRVMCGGAHRVWDLVLQQSVHT